MLALLKGKAELGSHDHHGRVVWQLEVVDARHHRGEEVVRILGRLHSLPHHCQRGVESLEP